MNTAKDLLSSLLPPPSGKEKETLLFPLGKEKGMRQLKKEPAVQHQEEMMLTQLADLTLQHKSKAPSQMQVHSPVPLYCHPTQSLLGQEVMEHLDHQDQPEASHQEEEGTVVQEHHTKVSKYYPYTGEGIDLLEKVHSLRLLNPLHPEGLTVTQILELERTFRCHQYPLATVLLMREVVQAYTPHLENRKDLPYMVTSMMPSIKAILYQETWDFIALVLMPALVASLSPSGWQQIYITLQWLLHSQTEPLLKSTLETDKQGCKMDSDIVNQALPEGWTPQLIKLGEHMKIPVGLADLSDNTRGFLESTLIQEAETNPDLMKDLVDHVIAADNINSGRLLKWLSCNSSIEEDNTMLRMKYMRLYKLVFKFGGDVIRTRKGPRLIIPVARWEEWNDMAYDTQLEFAWVVFMQTHQFHRDVWDETLWADDHYIWTYYLDLFWETGAYSNINQMVYKEFLTKENSALKDTCDPLWKELENKPDVYLPYSGITLCWDKYRKGWYRFRDHFTWNEVIAYSPTDPEGVWLNQGEFKSNKNPINSNSNSAWGSPVLQPSDNSNEDAFNSSMPSLMRIEDDSDDSSDSDISVCSSITSCSPIMVQSQFLSIS